MATLDDMAVYFFVRGDLREEDQMVQFGHAMFEMVASYGPAFAKYRIVGLDGGSSDKAFGKTLSKLIDRRVAHTEYSDPDHPEWGVTAIVTVPLMKEQALPLANYRLRRYSPPVGSRPSVDEKSSGEPGSRSSGQEHSILIERSRVDKPAESSSL